MRLPASQGERLFHLLRSLVRMAEKLQEPRCPDEAKDSGIQPIDKCMNAMCLRVVEADGPFEVFQRGDQLSEKNSEFPCAR